MVRSVVVCAVRIVARAFVLFGLLSSCTEPRVAAFETTVLVPLVGVGAPRAPGQEELAFHGTDLGFTYVQGGRIEILFGDTWANADGMLLAPDHDDAFGSLDFATFPDGESVERALASGSSPFVTFGLDASGAPAKLDPGHAMDPGKTPVTAFTTGLSEYGIFFLGKPRGCLTGADCGAHLSCDQGLGFALARWDDPLGLTIPCIDGMLGCLVDTMSDGAGLPIPGTGFCVDGQSSVATPDDAGRVASVAVRLRVGVRTSVRSQYASIEWLTNRFFSPTSTTVRAFDPALSRTTYDYRLARAEDAASGRVFLWGRAGFAGVNARGRSLHLYFAYADLPVADASGTFEWNVSYFTGVDASSGAPQFSLDEHEARALDLSGGPDDPAHEVHDLVQQMSIRYIEPLGRWVMLYGGGVTTLPTVPFPCGVLGLFAGPDCADVETGTGAIHVRFASDPWGPWSEPQDVLIGGVPTAGPAAGTQYAPGGLLRHPDCQGDECAPHETVYSDAEYGFLYGANIIDAWTIDRGDAVDVYWNVSSWDPYRVSLVRTRFPRP